MGTHEEARGQAKRLNARRGREQFTIRSLWGIIKRVPALVASRGDDL
jgi:hypothetical protein